MNHPLAACADQSISPIPGKVQAAQQFAYYIASVSGPTPNPFGANTEGRKLTGAEKLTYDAALSVLREYFNEEGLGDARPMHAAASDGEDPEQRIPVTV